MARQVSICLLGAILGLASQHRLTLQALHVAHLEPLILMGQRHHVAGIQMVPRNKNMNLQGNP